MLVLKAHESGIRIIEFLLRQISNYYETKISSDYYGSYQLGLIIMNQPMTDYVANNPNSNPHKAYI